MYSNIEFNNLILKKYILFILISDEILPIFIEFLYHDIFNVQHHDEIVSKLLKFLNNKLSLKNFFYLFLIFSPNKNRYDLLIDI